MLEFAGLKQHLEMLKITVLCLAIISLPSLLKSLIAQTLIACLISLLWMPTLNSTDFLLFTMLSLCLLFQSQVVAWLD